MKKQIHNIAASALIVTLMLTLASTTFADWQDNKNQDPEMQQKKEEMHQVIETGDYASFKALLENSDHPHAEDMLEKITEDNFDRFKEAHVLMQEAREKMDAAHVIFEELGISEKGHQKFNKRMMRPRGESDENTPQA